MIAAGALVLAAALGGVPAATAAECPQVYRIGSHSPADEALDILVLPDGFTDDELPVFRCAVSRMFEGLTAMSPFHEIASSLRVYRIDQASPSEGIEVPKACPVTSTSDFSPFTKTPGAPAFAIACAGVDEGEPVFPDGTFCASCTNADLGFFHDPAISPDCRVLWTSDDGLRRIWRYTRCAPDVDAIVVVANSIAHAGGGTADAHPPVSVVTLSEVTEPKTAGRLLGHEFGHALGLLDEYALGTGDVPEFQSGRNVVRRLPGGTIETPPWASKCENLDGTPASTCITVQGTTCTTNPPPVQAMPKVGLFEGAFYQSCGYFKASDRCLLDQEGHYCVGCRVYLEKLFRDLGLQPTP